MQPSSAVRGLSPVASPSFGIAPIRERLRALRVSLVSALTAILLLAVLSTALAVHLIWRQASSRSIDQAVLTLDANAAASVKRTLSQVLGGAEGAAEIIRSALFQGTIDANEEAKREFLFLSVLRSQPAVSWIGFGFPDGRFFGARAGDNRIEMIEISAPKPGVPAELRRDVYRPLPGDIFFEERMKATSEYVASGSPWYRAAVRAQTLAWTTADILPDGFEPSVVVSLPVRVHGEFAGIAMVAVAYRRLGQVLAGLDIATAGRAFVLDGKGGIIASSSAASNASRLEDLPSDDRFAAAVHMAVARHAEADFRDIAPDAGLGPVYVGASTLSFRDWRLLTAVPRSYFAGEIDRANRFLPLVVVALALVAAATSAIFAGIMFRRPLSGLSSQLALIEHFELDRVRHLPTVLSELDEFSLALKKMATGLASFGRFIPSEVVRMLVAEGAEAKPGGQTREITVMFADLPGFTEMSEKLGPAIEPYLSQFLTLAVEIVHREKGTVDKFIGDEVMAIWNAPGEVPDHAERALRAAAAIRVALHRIPLPLPGPGSFALGPRIRIGINTGPAIVGNFGSPSRLSYTAIGDTVNLASRLVGVAKDKGIEIATSAATIGAADGACNAQPAGAAAVRGKSELVQVYTL